MNKEETKIMLHLSDNLGYGGNIREMSEQIRKRYKSTYYSNIYNTIIRLHKRGIITIAKEGKNKLISLATGNPLSIYYMSEAENQKIMDIGMSRGLMDRLLSAALSFNITTMCALRYEEYMEINRIELLVIKDSHDQDNLFISDLLKAESLHNGRIDPLIATPKEFADAIMTKESNRIKDLISDKSILYNCEGFWEIIRVYKIDEKHNRMDRFPELSRQELAYNYNRFGYGLYEDTRPGKEIALEDTIFLMSSEEEARIRYGAFVLLHKNTDRMNWAYLYYLFKRHDRLDTLNGMLDMLINFCGEKDRARIKVIMEIMPKKGQPGYNKKLVQKYITQYG
jgi:predicted transcriptional regulator